MTEGAPWEEFLDEGVIDRETAEDWALDAWNYRTYLEGDMPYWYEERLTGEFDLHETRLDQHMIRKMKRLIDAGSSIDTLPDDVRDWWTNLA